MSTPALGELAAFPEPGLSGHPGPTRLPRPAARTLETACPLQPVPAALSLSLPECHCGPWWSRPGCRLGHARYRRRGPRGSLAGAGAADRAPRVSFRDHAPPKRRGQKALSAGEAEAADACVPASSRHGLGFASIWSYPTCFLFSLGCPPLTQVLAPCSPVSCPRCSPLEHSRPCPGRLQVTQTRGLCLNGQPSPGRGPTRHRLSRPWQ